MLLIICLLLFPFSLLAVDHSADALQAKDLLRQKIAELKVEYGDFYDSGKLLAEDLLKKKCVFSESFSADPQTSLYVFVSFGLPDEAWLTLSKELEKSAGVFVLRGLPENSFHQLAEKLHALRKKGMQATVQIDPRLFTRFQISAVPSFVVSEGDLFDKLKGNVSLEFALEKMASQGETAMAKTLRKRF